MKLTVVGFWGGFPQANGASSGYLLQDNGFSLLIDCGSAVLSKVQQYVHVMDLDAVILSHYHHDHIADIGPLQYARMIHTMLGKKQKELPIYGHMADQENFERLTRLPYTKGYAYNPEESLKLGPFTISFLKTKHPVVCYAMRITNGEKTICYTADSSFLPEFIDFAKDSDLLICECNLYSGQNGENAGHMTCDEAGFIAKEARVKKLLLTHLPHFGEHQELVEKAQAIYDGPVELAKEGWTF
ncbi:MBL fold metallo-hydrolase [Calidifontibacillus erzurumensis]|uniref:MBL fold metallo-hydrolase n=1 Tax=Calidifontibacillus erzurumensis TaxID=2741433 RepID=A0A8J8KCH4_9BACI|nr:MBL fold metallo-hydrolase [Calidifontibacillus erzurumensis]NSL52013.1 MBL fold metallo-hydrolase [Calidifontibacillus erzurumensis]